jgi:hypothetical protein
VRHPSSDSQYTPACHLAGSAAAPPPRYRCHQAQPLAPSVAKGALLVPSNEPRASIRRVRATVAEGMGRRVWRPEGPQVWRRRVLPLPPFEDLARGGFRDGPQVPHLLIVLARLRPSGGIAPNVLVLVKRLRAVAAQIEIESKV